MTNSQNSLALGIALAVIASLLLFALFNEPGESHDAAAGGPPVQRATQAAALPPVQPATKAAAPPVEKIEIAARYIKADEIWVVVVAPDLKSREELVTLAWTVWAQEKSAQGVQIFSNRDFGSYVQWTKNWPSSAEGYPAEWARKHHIGMVNRQLTAGRAPGVSRVFLTVYQEEKFGGWALIE